MGIFRTATVLSITLTIRGYECDGKHLGYPP
jgi:hypothetical protein